MAEHEKVLLTKSGIEKLRQERDLLVNVERPKVIADLQAARAQGDLSENADYDAARERQAEVEARIKEIDVMLQNAELIDEDDVNLEVVRPGMNVRMLDLADDVENEYVIVGSFETDPDNGKISNECPLAKAIMGHGVGDVVTVMVEEPYEVKILEIKPRNRFFSLQ